MRRAVELLGTNGRRHGQARRAARRSRPARAPERPEPPPGNFIIFRLGRAGSHFLTCFSAPNALTHAVCCALLRARTWGVLIDDCNLMVCPIYVFRATNVGQSRRRGPRVGPSTTHRTTREVATPTRLPATAPAPRCTRRCAASTSADTRRRGDSWIPGMSCVDYLCLLLFWPSRAAKSLLLEIVFLPADSWFFHPGSAGFPCSASSVHRRQSRAESGSRSTGATASGPPRPANSPAATPCRCSRPPAPPSGPSGFRRRGTSRPDSSPAIPAVLRYFRMSMSTQSACDFGLT